MSSFGSTSLGALVTALVDELMRANLMIAKLADLTFDKSVGVALTFELSVAEAPF